MTILSYTVLSIYYIFLSPQSVQKDGAERQADGVRGEAGARHRQQLHRAADGRSVRRPELRAGEEGVRPVRPHIPVRAGG